MSETTGQIISFFGIQPRPGIYWTDNRHDCMAKTQVEINIQDNGDVQVDCPGCGGHPTVFYECGAFSYFGGTIIG